MTSVKCILECKIINFINAVITIFINISNENIMSAVAVNICIYLHGCVFE